MPDRSRATAEAPRAKAGADYPKTIIQLVGFLVPLLNNLSMGGIGLIDAISELEKALESVWHEWKRLLDEKDREIARLKRERRSAHKESFVSARTIDRKTGLYTESVIHRKLVRNILDKRVKAFAFLYIDIFEFKKINDELKDHQKGDEVLKIVATLISNHLRAGDFAARVHGDEYEILLPNVGTLEDAVGIAERMILDVEHYPYQLEVEKGISDVRAKIDVGVVHIDLPLEIRRQIQPESAKRYAKEIRGITDRLMYEGKGFHHQIGAQIICNGSIVFREAKAQLKNGFSMTPVAAA